MQIIRFHNFRRELDIGTAARHVSGDCNSARRSGLGDNLGLLLMELGVED